MRGEVQVGSAAGALAGVGVFGVVRAAAAAGVEAAATGTASDGDALRDFLALRSSSSLLSTSSLEGEADREGGADERGKDSGSIAAAAEPAAAAAAAFSSASHTSSAAAAAAKASSSLARAASLAAGEGKGEGAEKGVEGGDDDVTSSAPLLPRLRLSDGEGEGGEGIAGAGVPGEAGEEDAGEAAAIGVEGTESSSWFWPRPRSFVKEALPPPPRFFEEEGALRLRMPFAAASSCAIILSFLAFCPMPGRSEQRTGVLAGPARAGTQGRAAAEAPGVFFVVVLLRSLSWF